MSRIAVIITDMFQDVEYERPAQAFRDAGHELTLVGLKAGVQVTGEHGAHAKIDRSCCRTTRLAFDRSWSYWKCGCAWTP